MADDTPEVIAPEEQEVAGGAIKSFLEHLEDLRWTMVKAGAALLCGLTICLFAAPQIMLILKRPLKEAWLQQSAHQVPVKLLGNTIGSFAPATNSVFDSLGLKGKTNAVIELVPMQVGTNLLMGLNIVTN